MSDRRDAAVTVAVRLRTVLDQLGDALRDADLTRLLAAESGLAAALAAFHGPLDAPVDQAALASEIQALRRSLDRCRRLGTTVDDFLRLSTGVLTPAPSYDRAGRERDAAPARVLEARY
ncbi:MAG: hypothetical protein AB1635_08905 [Acidobacteriota bacterium]